MSWSIYVKGESRKVQEVIKNAASFPPDADQSQIEKAKEYINAEIDAMRQAEVDKVLASQHPADAGQEIEPTFYVDVKANGHMDGNGYRCATINVERMNLLV